MEITLSPKYGVNPTIPVCFWCGEEKNACVCNCGNFVLGVLCKR